MIAYQIDQETRRRLIGFFPPRERKRYQTCECKVRHTSVEAADAEAARLTAALGKPYASYRCAYCQGVHVGRS